MKKVIKRCLYRDGLCSRRNGFGRWWHHKVVVQNGIQAFAKFKNAVCTLYLRELQSQKLSRREKHASETR